APLPEPEDADVVIREGGDRPAQFLALPTPDADAGAVTDVEECEDSGDEGQETAGPETASAAEEQILRSLEGCYSDVSQKSSEKKLVRMPASRPRPPQRAASAPVRSLLAPTRADEGPLTDVENLDSEDDNEVETKAPKAGLFVPSDPDAGGLTEVEVMSEEEEQTAAPQGGFLGVPEGAAEPLTDTEEIILETSRRRRPRPRPRALQAPAAASQAPALL
ncbi:Protein of unknown function, partial [Gryllus bimaculatus]